MKYVYDLSNHTNLPNAKRTMQMQTTNKIHYFHGRVSMFSALRTPFKLKLFNYSYRHHSEKTVHRGSMIEVVIPGDYFIIFH